MLFCTFDFLVFFTAVFALYWAMPWARARVWLLVISSFWFYAQFNKWLALIVGLSTAMDYFLALGMDRPGTGPALRKLYVWISVVANLGLLCYFKYANFFLESFYDALGWWHDPQRHLLDIILPVGISFYTFEAINYTVDVYRRRMRAERSLPHFLLFITFFPHLVAGPIVRARDFLPQIYRRKRWSWPRMHLGAQLILMGMFKKLAIADRMAAFADPVFLHPEQYRTGAVWLALIGYTLQLYCDFSGYTDMAIGCAHLLGYKLVRNFDMPYLATSIADYWRRWHISLSSWLRDYLFILLGGSRGSGWKITRNLFITFTLAGLWHGAAWHFVAFGVLQGVLLSIHRAFRDWCKTRPGLDAWLQAAYGTTLRWAVTLSCICLGYVLFRSQTFPGALEFYRRMFVPVSGLESPLPNLGLWLTVAVVVVAHIAGTRRVWEAWQFRLPAPVLGASYVTVLTLSLMLASGTQPFIYFTF
jgi:alginate O-acetyltransferase complex protein AlgI